MKFTVPPALIVTSFGTSACRLFGSPAAAPVFGNRLPGSQAPKLTVAVASGPLLDE